MARSVKKSSKKKTVKKVTAKKPSPKKVLTKKKAVKKAAVKVIAKKAATKKKVVSKKTASKKKVIKKAVPKKIVSKKSSGKKPVPRKVIKSQATLNEQTAKGNDYNEMLEDGNAAAESKNETREIVSGELSNTTSHAIPAPVEKYARPADPYHGSTAPVKRRSNIAVSGKKPLWKK